MSYWLNIHYPLKKGKPYKSKLGIYLKKIHKNTILHQIKKGDIGVIYEINGKEGNTVKLDNETVALREGRKGITAIVKIGKFESHEYSYGGDTYIGSFECQILQRSDYSKKPLISL